MEVWYGTIYTSYHKKETPKGGLLKTIQLYQPIEGAVRATGVNSEAARSKGKL
jgi:hypothetical protein